MMDTRSWQGPGIQLYDDLQMAHDYDRGLQTTVAAGNHNIIVTVSAACDSGEARKRPPGTRIEA